MSNLKKITEFQIWEIAKISNFESEKSLNFKFGNYLIFKISNFKLNYEKHGKSTSQYAFKIELQKISFSKITRKKQGRLIWLLTFSKTKAL
jgi:hypothetical protein